MKIRSVPQHLKGLPSLQRGVSGRLTKTASTAAHSSNQSRTLFSSAQASDQLSAVQFHTEQQTLGYSKEQMFEVVSRVEDYHKFVPWCKKSIVTMRTNDHLTASLVIGFPPIFGEAYNSHVVLFKPNIVTAVCTDMKLFHHLKTVWKFEDTEELDSAQACLVDFAVSFAFKSSMHSYLAQRFFDDVIKQNVNAFLTQAQNRYGPPANVSKFKNHSQRI